MNEQIIIFVGYIPDKNSGGNSIIPTIIKNINELYSYPFIYFYILFNEKFSSNQEMYLEMNKYEDINLPIVKEYMIENKNNIVIYPENCGNPLNFKNIVRFNFYFNIYEPSVDNEYNVFYSECYNTLYHFVRDMYNINKNIIKKENIFSKNFYYFNNLDRILNICYDFGEERENSCFTIRKGLNCPHIREQRIFHPENSYEILHENSNIESLSIIFNKYKYFYSYDAYTTMLPIAALCGCIPIIIPFSNFKSIDEFFCEEWLINGIAYGDSIEQINYAIKTRDKLIDSLKKKNNQDYTILYKEFIDSIYNNFKIKLDNEYNNIENILLSKKNNNNNELIILVYKLIDNINNNKILCLTDKINTNNFDHSNFNITYSNENKNLFNLNEFNYIFSENIIDNYNYRFLTHFYLNLKNSKNNIIKLNSYKYIPSKIINNMNLQTYINLNNNYNIKIPEYIHCYRPNFGSSKIIWSPSWNNISNNHFIIKTINNIGFNYYNRNSNLIDVVQSNDQDMINNFNNDILNNLNICIYQETVLNPLNMNKKVYFNWFFDTRNKSDYENDTLFVYQFPIYNIKENVIKSKYNTPIDINNYNIYPNCFPIFFNIKLLLDLLNNSENYNYKREKTCYVLRKSNDSHPLKFVDSVKDYFIHPDDSICIEQNNLEQNINMFLECNKFYCYDNVSFLAVIAVVCGCQTILIKDYSGIKDIRELYKVYCPWMYYGMAYEDNIEQLEFAKNTKHILIDILYKILKNEYANFCSEESSYDTILTFLIYLECYFNVSFNE